MAKQVINNGTFDNDPSAEKIRTSFDKCNSNFTELYDEKLSNDIADYPTASLPLSDTDKLLVNQGGTFKEVAKSEVVTSETFAQSKWMFNDFYSANNPLNREPFMGVAVNGGTLAGFSSTTPVAEHQGYLAITSGTSSNGGFRMITNNGLIAIRQGLTFLGTISIHPDTSARDRVIRIGFHDTVSNTAPNNGVYAEIIGSDLTFKATSSGVTSASSSITLVNGTLDLYDILIHATTNTNVRIIVQKVGGSVVLDTNLTTNIPTSTLNSGIISHIVTAGTNQSINILDYMGFGSVCPTFLTDRL